MEKSLPPNYKALGESGYPMKTIYIDADACSVKSETYKVAERWQWNVLVVANQYIQVPASKLIRCITVEKGDDIADDWIAERCEPGDVVITSDIPLASRCLEKGVRALGQKGREFNAESIGDALASRELAQNLREMGVMTGGPKPMESKDRSKFLSQLHNIIDAIERQS